MSYSFQVRAATKNEAKTKVAAELAKTVGNQPVHAHDQAQAQAAADSFINLLEDDDTKDVCVNVSGSLSWSHAGMPEAGPQVFTGANVSVGAYLAIKETPKG